MNIWSSFLLFENKNTESCMARAYFWLHFNIINPLVNRPIDFLFQNGQLFNMAVENNGPDMQSTDVCKGR